MNSGEGLDKSAADNNTSKDTTQTGVNATYELGYRYNDGGTIKKQDASLYDKPEISVANNSGQIFETTALAAGAVAQLSFQDGCTVPPPCQRLAVPSK